MFGQLLRFAGLWLAVAWPFEAGGDLSKDPGLLAALWDIPDPMTAFADLARRHDNAVVVHASQHPAGPARPPVPAITGPGDIRPGL